MLKEILPCDYCTERNRFADRPPLIKRLLGKLGVYQKCIGPTEPISFGTHTLDLKVYEDGRTSVEATTRSAQRCPAIVLDPHLSSIGEHILTLSENIPLQNQDAR